MKKMKKIILCILAISFIIVSVVVYNIYQKNEKIAQSNADNKTYESFYNKEVLGTDIISIINKATDSNEKNEIEKDEDGNYIENDENSIKIDIKFTELEQVITMERINKIGIQQFWKNYGALNFKCTKIEYHQKTNKVKYMYFEEI